MAQVIWNADIDVYDSQVIPIPVVKCIAKNLGIADLLSFRLVSKNAFETVNNADLWISRLKEMDLWDKGESPNKVKKVELSKLDPLTCMDHIVKSGKAAKIQVLKIYKCLHGYYDDLELNKPYDQLKIFKDFQTPEDQAKILTNLLVFNKLDYDGASSMKIRDKINALFEIFENALLRELDIHYDLQDYSKSSRFVKILIQLKNQQTLIDFFLQKSLSDNTDSNMFDFDSFDARKFFVEAQEVDSSGNTIPKFDLNTAEFDTLIGQLANLFNYESKVVDLIFPQEIPMMYKVCEEVITNRFVELIMTLVDTAKDRNVYLNTVAYFYQLLMTSFMEKLHESDNVGPSYFNLVRELIDMLFESFVAEYMREELQAFKVAAGQYIEEWKESLSRREEETTRSILKHVKVETKHDFLSSFKKVFTINASNTEEKGEKEVQYSEFQAKAKILSENLKSLNKIFSLDLVMEIINEAKISLQRLLKFTKFSIALLRNDVLSTTQDLFINVIETTGNEHLRPGFETALKYLKDYNPKELKNSLDNSESAIEPLVLFCELINMADMIIQMIDIFYKEDLLNKNIIKHENSILNPALQSKKKLESMVDNYVADGLNVGIYVLVSEIENIFTVYLKDEYYNPPPNKRTIMEGPTDVALKVEKILDENFDLLVGCTDKSIVEVYQQEIAERLFQALVKMLKKSTISVSGAVNLISDLNLYHDFILQHIKTNKRLIVPLFQSLKKVGSIYLIDGSDSKAIGKLVSDLSKFNGIFGQEEIYEFVQRREDWLFIKKDVEKIMYGLSISDCSIV